MKRRAEAIHYSETTDGTAGELVELEKHFQNIQLALRFNLEARCSRASLLAHNYNARYLNNLISTQEEEAEKAEADALRSIKAKKQ